MTSAAAVDDTVLVLCPVRDAEPHLDRFFELLDRLAYPSQLLAIGLLEGDSTDDTYAACRRHLARSAGRFRRVGLWQRPFGFHLPPGVSRHDPGVQLARRTAMARARNHLLFNALEADDRWVLWVDVDLIDYPPDILGVMLAAGRDIVHPDCTRAGEVSSFDHNAWRDHGRLHLDDLRAEGPVVPLDSVGGTMLLVRGDLHRDGLVFPCFPYGPTNPRVRPPGVNHWYGEVETEGLAMMAADMGAQCWGLTRPRTTHHAR